MTGTNRTTGPKEHLAGGRPWKWVFESLRAAAEPASLVPSLLRFSTPTLLQCCCDLPPQQVAADVTFLVQAASAKYLPVEDVEAARICKSACIFLRSVFQRLHLHFTAGSLLILLHFFQGTITSTSTVVALRDEDRTEAGRAKVEAVAALGHFLQQVQQGALLCEGDVSEHILFLLGLISFPVTLVPTLSRSDPVGSIHVLHEMEVQRLTFVAIGCLISQAGPLVSEQTWTITIQALRVVLESLASKETLVEDCRASRYYADLLRCVDIVVSQRKWSLKEHVGVFVKVLRMFFRYGFSANEGKTSCSSTWLDEKDSNNILEFDGEEEALVQINGKNALVSGNADSLSAFSFDTDENDCNSPVEDAFLARSSELRLSSRRITKIEGSFSPQSIEFSCRSVLQTTLLMVLLADPMPKLEARATIMLPGSCSCWCNSCSSRPSASRRKTYLSSSRMVFRMAYSLNSTIVAISFLLVRL